MNLQIVRRNENIVNDEVVSVQVHYKLFSADNKSMSNGFIETDQVDADIPELKKIVVGKLKKQVEQVDTE